VSTWWSMARRADIGLHAADLPGRSLALTNRAWYFLYRFLRMTGARNVALMAEPAPYITTNLANHWGACITAAGLGDWLQVGRWDGHAVVPTGIVHISQAGPLEDTCELTPLHGTPMNDWLLSIGQELATTPSGLHISGRPRKDHAMSVNLVKGGKVDLTKQAGGTLDKIRIGLGWDARKTDGPDYDLDASVVVLDNTEQCIGTDWFVYYNNLTSPAAAIVHQGDELTGGKEGDDEQIVIDLTKLPSNATDLRIVVTIYEARARGGQSFALVKNAFVRVIDESTGTELSRYDLSEDTEPGVNALVFGKVYRHDGGWNFRALGDGFTDELDGLVRAYKIG
jgi:tellurium resistance protein TerD